MTIDVQADRVHCAAVLTAQPMTTFVTCTNCGKCSAHGWPLSGEQGLLICVTHAVSAMTGEPLFSLCICVHAGNRWKFC